MCSLNLLFVEKYYPFGMKHNRCGGLMGCFGESARVSNYKYKYNDYGEKSFE